jgi:uncharacterized protein YggE
MYRWVTGLMLGLAALVVAASLYPNRGQAQKEPPPNPAGRTITVTGVGRVKMQGDVARITFGVRATGAMATADDNARKISAKVVKAIEGLKQAGLSIKTQPVDAQVAAGTAGPGGQAPPEKDKEKAAETFNVTHAVVVVLTDPDPAKLRQRVEQVLQTGLNFGVNSGGMTSSNNFGLGGGMGMPGMPGTQNTSPRVEFSVQNDADARKAALSQAAAAALANAEAVAGKHKVTVLSVSDGSDIPFGYSMAETTQPDGAGEIELTVRVRVTCSY